MKIVQTLQGSCITCIMWAYRTIRRTDCMWKAKKTEDTLDWSQDKPERGWEEKREPEWQAKTLTPAVRRLFAEGHIHPSHLAVLQSKPLVFVLLETLWHLAFSFGKWVRGLIPLRPSFHVCVKRVCPVGTGQLLTVIINKQIRLKQVSAIQG